MQQRNVTAECNSLFRLDDGSLLHVESVGRSSQRLPARSAIYAALLSDLHQCPIRPDPPILMEGCPGCFYFVV